MPIENERKYVLQLDSPEEAFSQASDFTEHIEQIYLVCGKKHSTRIRKSIIYRPKRHVEIKYSFTFKQDIGKKTVEVETHLDEEDYKLLSRASIIKFTKWRYRLGNWEVDFFKDQDKTYFVQAEIELPIKKKKPKAIHPLVKEHLVYAVKRGDGRFSSKKLGSPRYAQRIMQTLLLETKV